jgi:hypothetical protein
LLRRQAAEGGGHKDEADDDDNEDDGQPQPEVKEDVAAALMTGKGEGTIYLARRVKA